MSVHIYTRENRADLNMINNYKIKENKIRSKLQEIEQDRPNIICCIKNRSDAMGVDSHGLPVLERTLLSSIELEKKIFPIDGPIYVIKRHVSIRNITMPVLDVLDTRNTFFWVEFFRAQIVEHRWTEHDAKVFFKCSVSDDIIRDIVGDPFGQPLRDSVRKIYDRVYTQKNVSRLKRRLKSITSGEFISLEVYKEELSLLVRSYSVSVMLSLEEQNILIQKYFWKGLSSSIKIHLASRIDKACSVEKIIMEVFLFRQRMIAKYGITDKFTGVIYVKEQSNFGMFPMRNDRAEEEENRQIEQKLKFIDCSKPIAASSVIPFPSTKPILTCSLPVLKKIPSGIVVKNDPSETLKRIVLYYKHTKRERIFKKPIPGKAFYVYTGCIDTWAAGILLQDNRIISIMKSPLIGEQLNYTETEKCILAINKSRRIFRKVTGDGQIVFKSDKYNSFIYTTEKNISFIDGFQIQE
ncbi:hypothetical protein NEPAR04_0519 [Nematocida parisii]|nr:hypothetical protein NEPAR04_0519 [Nematocida parisii]